MSSKRSPAKQMAEKVIRAAIQDIRTDDIRYYLSQREIDVAGGGQAILDIIEERWANGRRPFIP